VFVLLLLLLLHIVHCNGIVLISLSTYLLYCNEYEYDVDFFIAGKSVSASQYKTATEEKNNVSVIHLTSLYNLLLGRMPLESFKKLRSEPKTSFSARSYIPTRAVQLPPQQPPAANDNNTSGK